MNNLLILPIKDNFPEDLSFEIVERKGIGHPDTLCDAIAEEASRKYSLYCLNTFNGIAHHWFDKVMLIGGDSDITFGSGKLIKPYHVIFAGKAALSVGDTKIPIEEILYNAAAQVLENTLRKFNAVKNLTVDVKISNYVGPGQKRNRYNPELSNLINIDDDNKISNDCNICVGFYPFTTLEKIVLELELELTSSQFKHIFPATGYDVKIVGFRRETAIYLQVNIPFIADLIENRDQYLHIIYEIEKYIKQFVTDKFNIVLSGVVVNQEKSDGRTYLTVTGSVADTGDVGVVGRGNRTNGLITPMRPMSIEASSGKNPIDHTGKIYNILSNQIAKEIYEKTNKKNLVILSTVKGNHVNRPDNIIVKVDCINEEKNSVIEDIVRNNLQNVVGITKELIFEGIIQW